MLTVAPAVLAIKDDLVTNWMLLSTLANKPANTLQHRLGRCLLALAGIQLRKAKIQTNDQGPD